MSTRKTPATRQDEGRDATQERHKWHRRPPAQPTPAAEEQAAAIVRISEAAARLGVEIDPR